MTPRTPRAHPAHMETLWGPVGKYNIEARTALLGRVRLVGEGGLIWRKLSADIKIFDLK